MEPIVVAAIVTGLTGLIGTCTGALISSGRKTRTEIGVLRQENTDQHMDNQGYVGEMAAHVNMTLNEVLRGQGRIEQKVDGLHERVVLLEDTL